MALLFHRYLTISVNILEYLHGQQPFENVLEDVLEDVFGVLPHAPDWWLRWAICCGSSKGLCTNITQQGRGIQQMGEINMCMGMRTNELLWLLLFFVTLADLIVYSLFCNGVLGLGPSDIPMPTVICAPRPQSFPIIRAQLMDSCTRPIGAINVGGLPGEQSIKIFDHLKILLWSLINGYRWVSQLGNLSISIPAETLTNDYIITWGVMPTPAWTKIIINRRCSNVICMVAPQLTMVLRFVPAVNDESRFCWSLILCSCISFLGEILLCCFSLEGSGKHVPHRECLA